MSGTISFSLEKGIQDSNPIRFDFTPPSTTRGTTLLEKSDKLLL
jgi:hypothetical protein